MQTPEAYERLRLDGTLVGDPAYGEPDFAEAYDWMRRQMARRLGPGSDGMLWLWANTTRRDLARSAKYARGEVLLTVRMPASQVLLSHFDDWHSVLNRSRHVAALPGETYDAWAARYDKIKDEWDEREHPYRELPLHQWPDHLRNELEATWESIFDLAEPDRQPHIQGTTRRVQAAEVTRAVRIV